MNPTLEHIFKTIFPKGVNTDNYQNSTQTNYFDQSTKQLMDFIGFFSIFVVIMLIIMLIRENKTKKTTFFQLFKSNWKTSTTLGILFIASIVCATGFYHQYHQYDRFKTTQVRAAYQAEQIKIIPELFNNNKMIYNYTIYRNRRLTNLSTNQVNWLNEQIKSWKSKNKPVRAIQIKLANIKNQINYNTKFDLEAGNAKYKQIKTQYPKYNAHYELFTGTDPNVNTNWKYVNYYDNQIQKQIENTIHQLKSHQIKT